jgi:hypothetical protein
LPSNSGKSAVLNSLPFHLSCEVANLGRYILEQSIILTHSVGLEARGEIDPGTRWEQAGMDLSTVLDYPQLKAEELKRWTRRPVLWQGPMWAFLKMLLGSPPLRWPMLEIGLESLRWARG